MRKEGEFKQCYDELIKYSMILNRMYDEKKVSYERYQKLFSTLILWSKALDGKGGGKKE